MWDGLIGDRGSDDTAVVQRAIDGIARAGGGLLELPHTPGGIGIRRLYVPARVHLHGPATQRATIRRVGADPHFIQIPDKATNVSLRDFNIHLSGTDSAAAVVVGAETADVTISGLDITAPRGSGFGLRVRQGWQRMTITSTTISGCETGMWVDGGGTHLTIQECRIEGWTERALYVVADRAAGGANDVLIAKTVIGPNAPGGAVRQPLSFAGLMDHIHTNVRIIDNEISGAAVSYLDPNRHGTADLLSLHACHGFEVRGNECRDGGDMGITVSQGCVDGTITGNRCLDNDAAGIIVGSGRPTSDVVVTGNRCYDNGRDRHGSRLEHNRSGIIVRLAANVRVDANDVGNSGSSQTQLYGFYLSESSAVRLSHNRTSGRLRELVLSDASPKGPQ